MRLLLICTLLLSINISLACAESLPFKQAVYMENNQNTLIDAKYPRFTYPKKYKKPIKLLNAQIRRFVYGLFIKFLSGDEVGRSIKKDLKSKTRKGSYKISFKVIRADDDFVSIRFKTNFDQEEGVQGLVYIYSLNYDMKNSKILHLTDLLEADSNDLTQILKFCVHHLEKKIGKSWHQLTQKDLTQFTFDKENLFINFNSYKLTNNALGAPVVKIPFQQLKGLKKDFISN